MTEVERKHAWYIKNAEKVKERSRQWAIDNPERAKELNKKKSRWYEIVNREKRRLKSKRYYEVNGGRSKEESREYYLQNKSKYSAYARKRLYGLTQEEFEIMLTKQEHKCAVCKATLDKPFVDHNHKTKKVRELLCKYCNSFIGLAKESSEILLSAIQYLKKHEESNV
jgi:DNA-directed RNA polymerase subunit RPC12/RpoP